MRSVQRAVVATFLVVGTAVGCSSFGTGSTATEDAGGEPDAPSADGASKDSAAAADASTSCVSTCDASCDDRCPTIGDLVGDQVRFETGGGALLIRDLVDCHLYSCIVNYQKDGGIDCNKRIDGQVARACSTSLPTSCASPEVLSLGVSDVDNCAAASCTYTCQQVTR